MKLCLGCDKEFDFALEACPECGWKPEVIEGITTYSPETAFGVSGWADELHEHMDTAGKVNNFWIVERAKLFREVLRGHFPDRGRWLEIGFGSGYVLDRMAEEFPNAELWGSDVFISAIKQNPHDSAKLIQLNALQVPFRGAFDGIGAYDVVEHIEDHDTVAREILAALKPGGVFLVAVPQHQFLWSYKDVAVHHVRRYSRKEMRQVLERAGFEIVLDTSFVFLLLPFLWVDRLMTRKKYEPEHEFALPGIINAIFAFAMRVDHWFIRRGVSFPIGGTRLVMGRKPLN